MSSFLQLITNVKDIPFPRATPYPRATPFQGPPLPMATPFSGPTPSQGHPPSQVQPPSQDKPHSQGHPLHRTVKTLKQTKQKQYCWAVQQIYVYHLCILHCIRDEGLSNPLNTAIVEVMPRAGLKYNNMNKHSTSTLH